MEDYNIEQYGSYHESIEMSEREGEQERSDEDAATYKVSFENCTERGRNDYPSFPWADALPSAESPTLPHPFTELVRVL